MWRYLILLIFLNSVVLAGGQWTTHTHEGEVIILFNKKGDEFSPDLKGLETLLSSQANDASFRHICFWNYLENDPQIQLELMELFKANYPSELKEALGSAGNMHNPKVISLRKFFSESLLKTPSVQKIDALFRKHGYTVSAISCEKFRLNKANDRLRFKAVTWLKITKIQQDGAEEEAKQLSLSDGDKVLMTYNATYVPSPDPKAPWYGRSGFIHPVYTPKGRVVTDGFPLDHLHQHGLMFAWTSAEFDGKPVDFWNSKKRQGKVEHVKTLQADADAIAVKLQHVINRGEKSLTVLKETWNLKRVPHASMNVFDLVSTQSCATDRPIDIRKYHYGGMCIRGPLKWNSGDNMLTSEGKKQADGNHSRPNWVTIFGEVDGESCGIAAMCHPDNFRAPQPVRMHPKFPYFCFAPMVLGEFKLVPDKAYVSRYRFVAFDGKPDPKQLNALWLAYTAGEKKAKKGDESGIK